MQRTIRFGFYQSLIETEPQNLRTETIKTMLIYFACSYHKSLSFFSNMVCFSSHEYTFEASDAPGKHWFDLVFRFCDGFPCIVSICATSQRCDVYQKLRDCFELSRSKNVSFTFNRFRKGAIHSKIFPSISNWQISDEFMQRSRLLQPVKQT